MEKIFALLRSVLYSLQIPIIILMLGGLAALFGIGLMLVPDIFSSQAGLPATATVTCGTNSPDNVPLAACTVQILQLSTGRFYVMAKDRTIRTLDLHLQFAPEAGVPRRLIIRGGPHGTDLDVQVFAASSSGRLEQLGAVQLSVPPGQFAPRVYLPLAIGPDIDRIRIRTQNNKENAIELGEIGLFTTATGPLFDNRLFLTHISPQQLRDTLPHILLNIAYAGVLLSFLLRRGTSLILPAFVGTLAFAATVFSIWGHYHTEWAPRDIPRWSAFLISESAGTNLNYGQYMALSLIQGDGLLPYWHRMPGYGLFCALAGVMSGTPEDLVTMTIATISLHLVFFYLAIIYFCWAAMRIVQPGVSVLIASILCFAPHQFDLTQVESVMISVIVILSGSMCLFLSQRDDNGHVSLPYHILLHASFALWFLIRPDITPGWFAVSLVLYYRSWRYLLIPVAFFLLIGGSWGLSKYEKTGNFVMTTSSFGASLLVGLWEVPHKFKWDVSDASYYNLVRKHGFQPWSPEASSFAVKETIRFWFTYPIYVISLVWHELMLYLYTGLCWPGSCFFPHFPYVYLHGHYMLGLLTLLALSFVYHWKALQTFLLGWGVYFNLTIFLLVFSGAGRFYTPPSASLLIAALPLLFETELYRRVFHRPLPALIIIGLAIAVGVWGREVDTLLIGWDELRYFAPFLDPHDSPLYILK